MIYYAVQNTTTGELGRLYRTRERLEDALHRAHDNWVGVRPKGTPKAETTFQAYMQTQLMVSVNIEPLAQVKKHG